MLVLQWSELTMDWLAHDMRAIAHWLRDPEMQGMQSWRSGCTPCIYASLNQCAIACMSCASKSMVRVERQPQNPGRNFCNTDSSAWSLNRQHMWQRGPPFNKTLDKIVWSTLTVSYKILSFALLKGESLCHYVVCQMALTTRWSASWHSMKLAWTQLFRCVEMNTSTDINSKQHSPQSDKHHDSQWSSSGISCFLVSMTTPHNWHWQWTALTTSWWASCHSVK